MGPTAVNALMSFSYAGPSVIHALTLSFYVGLIEILAGLLNLGGLINYISAPVISAFTSAVSIQVATSQVKGLLGLKVRIDDEVVIWWTPEIFDEWPPMRKFGFWQGYVRIYKSGRIWGSEKGRDSQLTPHVRSN